MRPLSFLLQHVEKAFVDGQNCPPCDTAASTLRQFSELLEASIGRRMPREEWSFIKSCAHRHKKTLQAAQRDQLEEAHHHADEVWNCVQSQSLSLEGRLLIQVFLPPADAYLFYKLEEFDRARQLILHISALDQRLVTDFGFVLLSAHRLQLGHNLLRIHTRLGEHSEAMQMGGGFLDYLELGVEPETDALLCARAVLDSVPDAILEHYFDKICGELAILLAGNTDAGTSELFQPLIHHADPEKCLGAGFGSHAHAWVHMKQLALKGEVEAFLETAIDLLQLGRMSEPSLWFATIIEIVGVCRSLGPEASGLADRMVAEASTLTDAPWAMKQAACTEYRQSEKIREAGSGADRNG